MDLFFANGSMHGQLIRYSDAGFLSDPHVGKSQTSYVFIGHIESSCGFISPSLPTIIYEDNYACIDQSKKGFIKGDRIKHISPKFFFTRELNDNYINIQPITSSKNLADIFTKSLPPSKNWLDIPSLRLKRLSKRMS